MCPKIEEPTSQEPKSSSTLTLKTEEKKSTSPSKEVISGQATSGAGKSADTISGKSADVISGQAAATTSGSGQSADTTSGLDENKTSKASSLSNEDLAKMWQPKSRPSLAQRLKCK